MKGVRCCFDKTYFVVQNQIKKQTKGGPMGPFLSLCMAELVMGNIEKKKQYLLLIIKSIYTIDMLMIRLLFFKKILYIHFTFI